jgi:ribose 5-phosphate isomerase B
MQLGREVVAIASDHAGFELKEHIRKYLERKGVPYEDMSAPELDPADDYPIFGFKVAQAIANGDKRRGILICGTGIGISIAANRYKGVRAALCTSAEMANMAREHNDANVLVMGGRTTMPAVAEQMVDTWLKGNFAKDRHERRVLMLDQPPEL